MTRRSSESNASHSRARRARAIKKGLCRLTVYCAKGWERRYRQLRQGATGTGVGESRYARIADLVAVKLENLHRRHVAHQTTRLSRESAPIEA